MALMVCVRLMTSDLVPLSIVDGARHANGRVSAAQVKAQVGLSLLQLHRGKVCVVDPGHVEHQAGLGRCPDLKLNDQPVRRRRSVVISGLWCLFTQISGFRMVTVRFKDILNIWMASLWCFVLVTKLERAVQCSTNTTPPHILCGRWNLLEPLRDRPVFSVSS